MNKAATLEFLESGALHRCIIGRLTQEGAVLRKAKWTTTRWKSPGAVRAARVTQLLDTDKHKDAFGSKYVDELAKRRDVLESRQWKFLTLQAPIVMFLVLSLLKLDPNVSVFRNIYRRLKKSSRDIARCIVAARRCQHGD